MLKLAKLDCFRVFLGQISVAFLIEYQNRRNWRKAFRFTSGLTVYSKLTLNLLIPKEKWPTIAKSAWRKTIERHIMVATRSQTRAINLMGLAHGNHWKCLLQRSILGQKSIKLWFPPFQHQLHANLCLVAIPNYFANQMFDRIQLPKLAPQLAQLGTTEIFPQSETLLNFDALISVFGSGQMMFIFWVDNVTQQSSKTYILLEPHFVEWYLFCFTLGR